MQAGIGESARQITGAVGQSGAATQKAIVENAQQVSGAVAKSGADTRASINANTQRLTVAVEETGRDAKDAISRTLEERISSIPEAISENLVPAIGKIAEASEGLAQQHASGAEGTLKNLVEKFTDSMGAEGAKQQEALAATTSQLKEAFSGFMGELKGFVETSSFIWS